MLTNSYLTANLKVISNLSSPPQPDQEKTHQRFEEFQIEVNVFLKDPLAFPTSPLLPSLTPQLMIKRAISYR